MPLHFLLDGAAGALLEDPSSARPGDTVTLTGQEAHHAAAVRRVRVGEEVTVGDGRGAWLTGECEAVSPKEVVVRITRRDDIPAGAELPWLYRTAGFVIANHRRKGRPVPVGELPDEIDGADPEAIVIADEEVREVLALLSPRDRRILLLNAWEGLEGEALATVLAISRGGADAALSRARSRLRAAWSERLSV